jgi:ArsR family metal-binding transcriptional regulator
MEQLKQAVNETHTNREQIKPTVTSRPVPKPLDIFKLLPGKNCRECGEPTCIAFALRMANGEMDWRKCPFLLTKELEGERAKLLEVFPDSD